MRIPLNIPVGPNEERFRDYFRAELRPRMPSYQGVAGRRPDGRLASELVGPVTLPSGKYELSIALVWAEGDQALEYLEILPPDRSESESSWTSDMSSLVLTALADALSEREHEFFIRSCLFYIGPALDGEYWLPGFRFAPVLPDDPDPTWINAERAVCIDVNVRAIDYHHGSSRASEVYQRAIPRLSLLLKHPLYRPYMQSRRWVWRGKDGRIADRSEREVAWFEAPELRRDSMPAKGELCGQGRFSGTLHDPSSWTDGRALLPVETKSLLRALTKDADFQRLFDRGARLRYLAQRADEYAPSAALAYRIAALDAISEANGKGSQLADFVRANTLPSGEREQLIDSLWGPLRSAHFHGGAFPLGEFAASNMLAGHMDPALAERDRFHGACMQLVDEAYHSWSLQRLAASRAGS